MHSCLLHITGFYSQASVWSVTDHFPYCQYASIICVAKYNSFLITLNWLFFLSMIIMNLCWWCYVLLLAFMFKKKKKYLNVLRVWSFLCPWCPSSGQRKSLIFILNLQVEENSTSTMIIVGVGCLILWRATGSYQKGIQNSIQNYFLQV